MDKFFIYEGQKPVAIRDNADLMTSEQIDSLYQYTKELGRTIHIRPIRPGDFEFDPVSGRRLNRIDTFVYPEFFDPIKD